MEKQKLLYQQARLHHRGASEMVLQTISASTGRECITAQIQSLCKDLSAAFFFFVILLTL